MALKFLRMLLYRGSRDWTRPTSSEARDMMVEAVHRDIRTHPAASLSEAIEAVSSIVQRYTELIPSEYRLSK